MHRTARASSTKRSPARPPTAKRTNARATVGTDLAHRIRWMRGRHSARDGAEAPPGQPGIAFVASAYSISSARELPAPGTSALYVSSSCCTRWNRYAFDTQHLFDLIPDALARSEQQRLVRRPPVAGVLSVMNSGRSTGRTLPLLITITLVGAIRLMRRNAVGSLLAIGAASTRSDGSFRPVACSI